MICLNDLLKGACKRNEIHDIFMGKICMQIHFIKLHKNETLQYKFGFLQRCAERP
jgi:hypothetical protein